MKRKQTGGGRYDPAEAGAYFVASSDFLPVSKVHRWNLIALNDLGGAKDAQLREVLDAGNRVLLDSGIFWLTQRHMRDHPGMRMDQALALAPNEIDGFDALYDAYLNVVREYEDDLWGYIELDQGGATNKRRTRAKLERAGLRPIPVYHPLNDGWDYFDELCTRYDRICLGNVVQANAHTRKHLLATLWERRRRYPDVWVHVLGLTLNEVTTVYPVSSCDSSSWVYAIRFGAQSAPGAHAMGDSFGKYPTTFSYDQQHATDAPAGVDRGVAFLSGEALFMHHGMRRQADDLVQLFGADALLPAHDPRELVRT